ncbi:MAG: hypothetical protein Fur0037_18720 [Planctomycetota bacterium]
MHSTRAGFTLIELLVVIGILSMLVVTFAPDIIGAWSTANQAADAQNMRQVYSWIENDYKRKIKHYPFEGGHKFVLAPWVDGIIEKTPKNFDRFFNPALTKSNSHYHELRASEDLEHIWPDFQSVSSLDTDYAGRAKEAMKGSIDSGKEAWMADDNEDGWAFKDGTINILYGDGTVRTLVAKDLKDRFGWTEITREHVFPTYGPDSPHEDLRKLEK